MRLHSLNVVDRLIDRYIEKGGESTTLMEGCLGYGTLMLHGPGLKTAIIREVPLNSWSSAHTIRLYNRMPKKYERMLEKAREE